MEKRLNEVFAHTSISRSLQDLLWDPATGRLRQTLDDHWDSVNLVAFSPDGRMLASGSWDKTVRLWDTATEEEPRILMWDQVTKLEFFQDRSRLITNLGILDIQSPQISTIFIEQGEWINKNDKDVLWLPPEFRPRCSVMNGDSLALGHASGRVSYIRFCL